MKSHQQSRRQRGFFDLGLSLLVLALAGGIVYGVESERAERIAAEQAEQPVLANNTASEEITRQ